MWVVAQGPGEGARNAPTLISCSPVYLRGCSAGMVAWDPVGRCPLNTQRPLQPQRTVTLSLSQNHKSGLSSAPSSLSRAPCVYSGPLSPWPELLPRRSLPAAGLQGVSQLRHLKLKGYK